MVQYTCMSHRYNLWDIADMVSTQLNPLSVPKFFLHWKQCLLVRDFAPKMQDFHIWNLVLFKVAFGVDMKSKKLPPAHVFDLKNRLGGRMMFWFALADSYDVKQDSRHTWCVLGTQRNFFHGTKARPSRSQKLSFWTSQTHPSQNCLWSGYEI